MNIGQRLLNLIEEREITQKELSDALNVAPSTINGYIKKGREPDIEMLRKIAVYFDVTIDYLVNHNCRIRTPQGNILNENETELIDTFRMLYKDQQTLLIEQGKLMLKLNNQKKYELSDMTSKTTTVKSS